MNESKLISRITFWMLILFLFPQVAIINAQVVKMSDKDLTEKSTAVLYGKCSKVKSSWNANKSIIMTDVTIIPEEYLKGNLGSEAVISVPGGRVGDIVYEVSEMPLFAEGEDVVAFVWTNPSGKNLLTGGYQGKMKIQKDKVTGKRMVDENDVDYDIDGQLTDKKEKSGKIQLDEFAVKIKGYMKN